MNLKQLVTIPALFAFSILLISCAGSSEDQTEAAPEEVSRDAGEGATYTREEVEKALHSADQAIARASSHGGDASQQSLMLEDARLALEAEDLSRSAELAMAAEHGANQIYNEMLLAKARELLDKVGNSEVAENDEIMERISEVEIAYQVGDGELAYDKATALYDETLGVSGQSQMALPETPAAPEPEAQVVASSEPVPLDQPAMPERHKTPSHGTSDSYTVVRGDSLWKISARPAIYDNPYQWPLIYKTNKHQIRDPDLIHPGQDLDIDQNVSDAEAQAAINHARSRGQWALGEVEDSDVRYLKSSDSSAVAAR